MIEFFDSIDRQLFIFLNQLNAPWLNSFMSVVSGQVLWLPLIAMVLFLVYRSRGKEYFGLFFLFLLLATVASDVSSSYIIKNFADRLRPCRVAELKAVMHLFGQKCGGKYGFVSSHASNSVVLVFLLIQSLKEKFKWIHLLWLMPFLISYSRIYLGVHYPGDTVAGGMVGLFWGNLTWKIFVSHKSGSKSA